MKVFIYESENELGQLFQLPDSHIPFLSSSLLKHMGSMVVRSSIEAGEDYQIFLPSSWRDLIENQDNYSFYSGDVNNQLEKNQKKEYELVLLTNLFSVMLMPMLPEDISHLKQNPEKLFSSRGTIGGYLKRGQELPSPEEYSGFGNTVVLSYDNFLRIHQDLVNNITLKSKEVSSRVYGSPIILSEEVSGSTVCGPSYIGEGVRIYNSYIAPGTTITGDCVIQDSEIFSSFIFDSTIISSKVKDSVLSETNLSHADLTSGTRLPSGSVIVGDRKV